MRSSKRVTQREALLSLLADDADIQRAVVQMRGWAEKLAAAELQAGAEAADDETWVRAVPAEREADKPGSRLARLGTAVLMLAILRGVALVALRLR